ncbi:ANTH domain-containing protein, partial [Mycena sp. CBHHK59/15]
LIVLHTMIRNGSTDNVLGYLSGSQVLRLSNVSTGNWEELQHYAAYLDARIHAYRDLKHDAVRVQSDSNRDARITTAAPTPAPAIQRSKTLAGRKLRSMTVEKGLLRETRAVHRMLDALVACRFYLDDLEDPLTLTALRMLVKDLLILFQAGNEGVINVLENYFEIVVEYLGIARKLQNLVNVPAPVSLAGALQEIEYRTNKEAARRGGKGKSSPVPPLPTSTASASAKTNGAATSSTTNDTKASADKADALVDFFAAIEDTQPTMFNPQTNSPNTAYFQQQASNPNPFQRMQQTGVPQLQVQQTGFPGQPTGALQAPNPFGAYGGGARPVSSFVPAQATGMGAFAGGAAWSWCVRGAAHRRVRSTANGCIRSTANRRVWGSKLGRIRHAAHRRVRRAAHGRLPATTTQWRLPATASAAVVPPSTDDGFAEPVPCEPVLPAPVQGSTSAGPAMGGGAGINGGIAGGGLGVGLRPQMTGGAANPFRASMMFGQATGPAPSVPSIPGFAGGNTGGIGVGAGIARPASAPLGALPGGNNSAGLMAVKTHQTGSRNNPFGQPAPREEVPALPTRLPTLMELAMGAQQQQQMQQQQQQQQAQQQAQQQLERAGPGATDISSVASSFASSGGANTSTNNSNTNSSLNGGSSINGSTTGMSDAGSGSLFSSSFTGTTAASSPVTTAPSLSFSNPGGGSFSPTGTGSPTLSFSRGAPSGSFSPTGSGFGSAASSSAFSSSGTPSPLSSQPTGGMKAFKPSSSFGASLLEALPPIPGSAPGTPAMQPQTQTQTGFFAAGTAGGFGGSPSPTGGFGASSATGGFGGATGGFGGGGGGLGAGLRPQMTGGAANPFRASMALGAMPTGAMPQQGSFGGGATDGAYGSPSTSGFGAGQAPQQQNGAAWLI